MADLSAEDAATRQRIIGHMNADHQESVIRYVEHLKGVSSIAARNAKITDIALNQLTISNGSSTWRIALEPPMASMRDARERLITMDQDALKALNRSDIPVKEYRAPRGIHLVVFVLCLVGYISFLRKEHMARGSWLYNSLPPYMYLRDVADIMTETYPLALILMVGIHATEATIFLRTRLVKHSVPVFSRLWWTWLLSVFIEGFGAFQRFDCLVREGKAKKEKLKH